MSKYGAVATTIDGIRFPSKREAARYGELKLLERAGEIADLALQQRYPLNVYGTVVGHYVADFVYRDVRAGVVVVEDAKGVRTPVYRLKRKLMAAIHGVEIREV